MADGSNPITPANSAESIFQALKSAQVSAIRLHPNAGVSWSALTPDRPVEHTDAELLAMAEREASRRQAWAATDEGAYRCAVSGMSSLVASLDTVTTQALSAASRSFEGERVRCEAMAKQMVDLAAKIVAMADAARDAARVDRAEAA